MSVRGVSSDGDFHSVWNSRQTITFPSQNTQTNKQP